MLLIMDDTSCWNSIQISTPAITTLSFAREQLDSFCHIGGHHLLEEWLVDLCTTQAQLSRELNQPDITRLMTLETSFLHQIVQQRVDIRSEKFFPKMKQASRAARRWLQFCTPKLVDDVSQLMKTPKTGAANKLLEYRLASPAIFRHLLCHLARGHGTLRQTAMYCEEAAVWLQCKMAIAQRSGLALALYSVVARLRALSLYLMRAMSTGYEKLSVLLFGVPLTPATDSGRQMVLDGLPKHLRDGGEEEKLLGKKRMPDIKSLLGDIFNDKAASVPSTRATQPLSSDRSDGPATSCIESECYETTAPPPSSASQLNDVDLGEVIVRSSLPSTKKRKRDTLSEELSTKKHKDNKVVKKKKKQVDTSNSDTCTEFGTANNHVKNKKKKRINDELNFPNSPSQIANETIHVLSGSAENSCNVSFKNKVKTKKKSKKILNIGDTAECLGETPPESLSEMLGTFRRKFNSKSSLHARVEMDPTGGANGVEESKENAAMLKKSNSFLKTCNSLLHIPQAMAKKTISTTNPKNQKNKPKKKQKSHPVPVA